MTVHLVGAGPGDPDLLTVRAARLLAAADVVVYDRRSMDTVLELVRPEALRVPVGRVDGRAAPPQAEINRLLVELGRRGGRVVRLKSGDPFVASRGGEEALALAAAGVPFEVVPGVTAAVAAPAYAGIPVMVRQVAHTMTVIAGNDDPEHAREVDWEAAARLGGTIVVLTGRAGFRANAARLLAAGLPASTPVAAISAGSRAGQRTARGTLGALPDLRLKPPVTFVVGEVAGIDLGWFRAVGPSPDPSRQGQGRGG